MTEAKTEHLKEREEGIDKSLKYCKNKTENKVRFYLKRTHSEEGEKDTESKRGG